jgi:hypothetical protein
MGRGPSYPYTDLEGAIVYTRKVYDYVKRGSAAVEAVVKDGLKLSPTSSGSQKVIAALRSFGLIEDAPGANSKAVKLSTRAIRILLDEPDSQERREELKKAALAPKWYEYCWSKWGKDMPPAMRSNLLIEHGFIESTVDGFLNDYRKSIAFAGLLDDVIFSGDGKSKDESKNSFKIGDWVQWERPGGILGLRQAKRLTGFSPKGDFAFVEDESTGIPINEVIAAERPETPEQAEKPFAPPNLFVSPFPVPPAKPAAQGDQKMQTDVIAIGGNSITIQIQWPTEINQEAYDDLVDYLALLQKRAKRAIKPAGQGERSSAEPQGEEHP